MKQPIVVKIGTNVITNSDGSPDFEALYTLVAQFVDLKKTKNNLVIISSGAVAFGRKHISINTKTDTVEMKQMYAAVGQYKLMAEYDKLFSQHNITCAQLLVTKEDFRDRQHFTNLKRCLLKLIENNIIPIINENDSVAVSELMFTDNDELAGFIASILNAKLLLILTNVNGLFNKSPHESDAELITEVNETLRVSLPFISSVKSSFGRGGMSTKAKIAQRVSGIGIPVRIANGKENNVVIKIINGEKIGTFFTPQRKKSAIKKWVAHSESFSKGEVIINNGAKEILFSKSKAVSLLPVGILKVVGFFEKNDVIKLISETGEVVGFGIAMYSSEKAKTRIGLKKQPPLIHYDYLYLNELSHED